MSRAAIGFVLDGRGLLAQPGQSLLQAAQAAGIDIPHLCWKGGLDRAGNCRACMVEVEGERVLAAACCREPEPGMQVHSRSPRARAAQRTVLGLLQSDLPAQPLARDDEVRAWADRLQAAGDGPLAFAAGAGTALVAGDGDAPAAADTAAAPAAWPARASVPADLSHPAIAVQLDACIQCTRCVRACREVQGNGVIGLAGRGPQARIVFDLEDPLGQSSCVACGECVQACPTGALSSVQGLALQAPQKEVRSVCPYCGVGCQVALQVRDNRVVEVRGLPGPANDGRLCVKGRYGFDYLRHPHRLTTPLIRRADAPKSAAASRLSAQEAMQQFRPASWEEALAHAGAGLRRLRDRDGPGALAGFGSAKGSNEEAYLFQKLVRLGFGSNNVDHCTRLCHASSVAALLEGIGSGAVSNPVRDVQFAEVVIVIGANPVANHPVAATWIKNAVAAGTRLLLLDPRRSELAQHAHLHLQFQPDTDVALLNAMMHTLVEEDLVDHDFIARRTEGFEALVATLAPYSPERMAPVTGIAAPVLRQAARLYARSRASMILWGMGISQHEHGTDNARCLIALALMTGHIGRPGTGLHPLRGQNNVQGASDAGLIPMMWPDYQRVTDPQARQRVAAAWGVPPAQLDDRPGLTVVEVMNAIHQGQVRGMLIMGENPAMSDPDVEHARQALAHLDTLVVQDLFLTETAALADVVLPASAFAEKCGTVTNTDRTVQRGERAVPLPGQARQDLWILTALAAELGLDWSGYGATPLDCDEAASRVFDEMRSLMPGLAGIDHPRLRRQHAVTYPCLDAADPGQPVVFQDRFPTADGRARFVPARYQGASEQPDAEYPWVLITGRQLEHWHTGSMTRRSRVLHAIEPEPVAWMHPADLRRLGVDAGAVVTLRSRRGQTALYARADAGTPEGTVFVAFCWFEAAINALTNPTLDPVAKIPGFKYCAVAVQPGGTPPSGGALALGMTAAGDTVAPAMA